MTGRDTPVYRPLTSTARALGAFALLSAAAQSAMFAFMAWGFARAGSEGSMALNHAAVDGSRALHLFMSTGQMAMTLWFFLRAEANNAARGRRGKMSRAWLAVGFFVPLYGLMHRWLVAKQAWEGTGDARHPADVSTMPASLKLWGAWGVAMGALTFLVGITSFMVAVGAGLLHTGMQALEAGVEAVLAVQMARALDARQALRHGEKPAGPSMASLIGHVPDGPAR